MFCVSVCCREATITSDPMMITKNSEHSMVFVSKIIYSINGLGRLCSVQPHTHLRSHSSNRSHKYGTPNEAFNARSYVQLLAFNENLNSSNRPNRMPTNKIHPSRTMLAHVHICMRSSARARIHETNVCQRESVHACIS